MINRNDLHYYSFPILSDDYSFGNSPIQRNILRGTCFSLGNGIFITAAHVAAGALEYNYSAVGVWEEQYKFYFFGKQNVEIFDRFDLAILKTNNSPNNVCQFMWEPSPQPAGILVRAPGFAHGLDLEQNALILRNFTGFIVSSLTRCRNIEARCGGYELTFVAPIDLSGAPLLTAENNIIGYITGVASSGTEVNTSERVDENSKEIIRTKEYERINFGIAVRSEAILELESQLLGGNVINYLRAQKLIA
jgi:hypothetical protein